MLPLLYFSSKMFKHNTDDLDSMESYNSSKQKKSLKIRINASWLKKLRLCQNFAEFIIHLANSS